MFSRSIAPIKVAIITVSDTCSSNEKQDLSGEYLQLAFQSPKYTVLDKVIVPDFKDSIQVFIHDKYYIFK